ncbi:hypothetical protein ACXYTP_21460 [Tsukamurella ocularis]
MTEPDDATPALPDWVERVMADQRAYWNALRDGGAITVEEGWGMVQREWGSER